ncbi:hypothetical protein [Burkholderia latens]|uniref:Uncharacterized protein n=1 Tax=Burkholderia latens TaxID=488446 RepID=A0A6H9TC91_9BURK|nr:hypothetical protein [Burkholderia latens]KAB0642243.1 hypothetical protein F7R21_12645 [Burkholderia latens]
MLPTQPTASSGVPGIWMQREFESALPRFAGHIERLYARAAGNVPLGRLKVRVMMVIAMVSAISAKLADAATPAIPSSAMKFVSTKLRSAANVFAVRPATKWLARAPLSAASDLMAGMAMRFMA